MITKINDFINEKNAKPAAAVKPVNENTDEYTDFTYHVRDILEKSIQQLVTETQLSPEEIKAKMVECLNGSIEEGLGSIVSNIVNNDKKMGETLTKNLQVYINTKPKTLVATPEEMKAVFDLAQAAKFYTKDIKFENDNQKAIWEYLKTRASKSMNFGSSGGITPAS